MLSPRDIELAVRIAHELGGRKEALTIGGPLDALPPNTVAFRRGFLRAVSDEGLFEKELTVGHRRDGDAVRPRCGAQAHEAFMR